MSTPELRVAVLGVGMMGANHVDRITRRIDGARVAVVNDYATDRANAVAAAANSRITAGIRCGLAFIPWLLKGGSCIMTRIVAKLAKAKGTNRAVNRSLHQKVEGREE